VISSRRRAPGKLGPLYNQKIDLVPMGIGSYEAVSGSPTQPGPAEQALIGVVQVAAAAGPYCRWAERGDSGAFTDQPSSNRLLYVLNDQQILAAERMIGEPPAYLGVLTDRPGSAGAVSAAFADGRYRWVKTEALYRVADQGAVPAMVFLHWGELRPVEDWKSRTASAQLVATRLGGTLVFPVVVPVSPGDRERPLGTFDNAFKAQFPDGGALPQVVRAPESGTAIIASESAKSGLLVLGIVGALAVATWAGYRMTREAQRSPA
jgi:hypothetical protein